MCIRDRKIPGWLDKALPNLDIEGEKLHHKETPSAEPVTVQP